MKSMIWVLVIVVSGWGAGAGSQGNAVGSVEFLSQAKCEAAASAIKSGAGSVGSNRRTNTLVYCFQR